MRHVRRAQLESVNVSLVHGEKRERGKSKWELSLCISSSDERQNGRVEQSQTGTLRLYPFCASASKSITTRGGVSYPYQEVSTVNESFGAET